METVLQFIDDGAKAAAFAHAWGKLEAQDHVELDTFKTCVRLLPAFSADDSVAQSYNRLCDLVVDRLHLTSGDSEYLYVLSETCFGNPHLAVAIFSKLTAWMTETRGQLHSSDNIDGAEHREESSRGQELLLKFQAYLRLIASSYWLPPECFHYVSPTLLGLLVGFVGHDLLDESAHDTLSALLDLMRKPWVVVLHHENLPTGWSVDHVASGTHYLNNRILGGALFEKFESLPFTYFSSSASKAFRTWFQWVSLVNASGAVRLEQLYRSSYWAALHTGLVSGFADQRKYCLAILQISLQIPQRPIDLPQMTLHPDRRRDLVASFSRYASLFETVVLDRYPNQVQACLSDLSALVHPESLVPAYWTTALISAALNSKVQDGIRKIVGNWYLAFAINHQGSLSAHTTLLTRGFLPWATQGSLFTHSLVSTRSDTKCAHGESLAKVVERFTTDSDDDGARRSNLEAILTFALDTEGKIFAPSVLYLLQGVLQGLRTRTMVLRAAAFQLMLQVSLLPALPEIGTDLCSTYLAELSCYVNTEDLSPQDFDAYTAVKKRFEGLVHSTPAQTKSISPTQNDFRSLPEFNKLLDDSQHMIIQDAAFGVACNQLLKILDSGPDTISTIELGYTLNALWEEADRQEFPRNVVTNIIPLLFHPTCAHICARATSGKAHSREADSLVSLLAKALVGLEEMTHGRPYVFALLARSVRRACFADARIHEILQVYQVLGRLIEDPPVPKKEFLFEVAAAQKLQRYAPERDYDAYYGQREWHGYAALIDMLDRTPAIHSLATRDLMDRLLDPWRTQQAPVPVISKWKRSFQLQIMLLLTESCISSENAERYLDSFFAALIVEQWPRFRYLLEWIIARIFYRFPNRSDRILTELSRTDDYTPVHVASLIRLGVLCAPFLGSQDFALRMMIHLIPLSASQRVQIRHEAHWSFPTLFDICTQHKWTDITDNPAFRALNDHVRGLEKFSSPPASIRTLKLDVVEDYTITKIFQGRYLSIETPELEHVARQDFVELFRDDSIRLDGVEVPPARVPLGDPLTEEHVADAKQNEFQPATIAPSAESNPAFFQTKSGFDIASLLPSSGPPSAQRKRPTSVILIASLIDNPTNIGGLSRISESFGLEALYIDDIRKTAHRDFKATSVTSEKHFPIRELKVAEVPDLIMSLKRQGYEIVGIEQTDRSGVLGEDGSSSRGVGTLPQKCVLVLGSERGGISSEVLAVLDRCVEIRTVGVTRSLNVQTAGGIAMYEWWREWSG